MMPNSATPAMRRLVAIGRCIKVSEIFTPSPLYPPRPRPQIADGQAGIGNDAEQRHASHEKTGGDRPMYKGFGNIHAEPPLAPPSAAPAAASASAPGIPDYHLAAGRQAQLSFNDDGFSGADSLIDHHILADARTGHDRAGFDGLIFLDDVDKGPGLAGLNGLIGDHDGIGLGSEQQGNTHELAGPQLVIGIGERSL